MAEVPRRLPPGDDFVHLEHCEKAWVVLFLRTLGHTTFPIFGANKTAAHMHTSLDQNTKYDEANMQVMQNLRIYVPTLKAAITMPKVGSNKYGLDVT